MGKNPYKIMGVKPDATLDEIKARYRRLAKRYHPDVNPKTSDKFADIAWAWSVLSDPEAREKYDLTGETDNDNGIESRAYSLIASILNAIVDANKDNLERVKVLETLQYNFKNKIKEFKGQEGIIATFQVQLESKLHKITFNKDLKESVIHSFFTTKIEECRKSLIHLRTQIQIGEKALEILKEYQEELPPEATNTSSRNPFQFGNFTFHFGD